jgi:hypothetical protein
MTAGATSLVDYTNKPCTRVVLAYSACFQGGSPWERTRIARCFVTCVVAKAGSFTLGPAGPLVPFTRCFPMGNSSSRLDRFAGTYEKSFARIEKDVERLKVSELLAVLGLMQRHSKRFACLKAHRSSLLIGASCSSGSAQGQLEQMVFCCSGAGCGCCSCCHLPGERQSTDRTCFLTC